MSNVIYQDKQGFKILSVKKRHGDAYIVLNSKKGFQDGHTHINNYHMCKHVIWCVKHRFLDSKLNSYLLTSVLRLTQDREFARRLQEEIWNKEDRNN